MCCWTALFRCTVYTSVWLERKKVTSMGYQYPIWHTYIHNILFIYLSCVWLVGTYFPNQGLNLGPCQWKCGQPKNSYISKADENHLPILKRTVLCFWIITITDDNSLSIYTADMSISKTILVWWREDFQNPAL